MNIAICEDEILHAQSLEKFIMQYYEGKQSNPVNIKAFGNGTDLLGSIAGNTHDIVFMDIYMKQENGIDAAKEILKADPNCLIVFTTISNNYAVEAFDLDAVHYLTKPLSYEKVASALARCDMGLIKKSDFITVKTSEGIRKIFLRDIFYIEVLDNIIRIFMKNGNVRSRITLNEIETQIKSFPSGSSFLRCHRSFLVNMEYISGVKGSLFVIENGSEVLITKHQVRSNVKAYESYLLAETRGAK